MRFLLLIAAAIAALLPVTAYAQPDPAWARIYDGEAHRDDIGEAIAVDGAGNAYVTGFVSPADNYSDFLVIKYRPDGDTAWLRTYDGPAHDGDGARAIAIDGAGNAYITGASSGAGTGRDLVTIKYDSSGDQQWVARYTTPGHSDDAGLAVALGPVGNVYVAGYGGMVLDDCDYVTIKYGPDGDTLWVRRFHGDGDGMDYLSGLAVDSAGNAYVTGTDGSTAVTVKYSSDGNLAWSASYTPACALAIAVGEPDRVYVGGIWPSPTNGSDALVLAYDAVTGDTAWVSTWDGAANDDDFVSVLAVATDGSLYGTGGTISDTINWDYDCLTIKWQQNGDTSWVRTNPGLYPGQDDDFGAIALDASGNAYLTGAGEDSTGVCGIVTAKYDADGTEDWRVLYRPDAYGYRGHGIALHDIGGTSDVYVVGDRGTGLPYSYDCVTIKYTQPTGIEQPPSGLDRPNVPFTTISRGNLLMPLASDAGRVESVLLNAAGRRVATLQPGPNDVSRLAPGVYFVRYWTGQVVSTGRLTLVR